MNAQNQKSNLTAADIITSYISFFEKRGHTRIQNAALVPDNDPTTLFTSSGMQPLVPYLLGETHPAGTRLVNVQNSFRAQDIEEIGDNRHTTFFRMLGNWSLGDYFKEDQLPWFFEFLIKELKLDPNRLYVTVFAGDESSVIKKDGKEVPLGLDTEAITSWKKLFGHAAQVVDMTKTQTQETINMGKIFMYGVKKNWWSRSGTPDKMPTGEPGGPDSEVFYDFGEELKLHENSPYKDTVCHPNCDCGRYLEIGNSVFMQYQKQEDGSFKELPKKNVDFGGGLERLLAAVNHNPDMFKTSLLAPIIKQIEQLTEKGYEEYAKEMRIVTDHFLGAIFISAAGVKPSNKEQGYILRRLIRRGLDYLYQLKEITSEPIVKIIVEQYKETDPILVEKFEEIKLTILEEEQKYANTRKEAKRYIEKKYKGQHTGDELFGTKEITSDDAFYLYTSQGLSPTQIKSLGYSFDEQAFAEKMKAHKDLSKTASAGKFKGGLADTQELTVKGHTATHLLQQALRDVLGHHVFQTGSNITTERLRFDFSHNDKLTDEQIKKTEAIVREKIADNLPVHFEMLDVKTAKNTGAIGLFDNKYEQKVKVYFIGGSGKEGDHDAYSKEFCGGPHVEHTNIIKSFTITKQEKLGQGQMRLYAKVE